MRNYLIFLFFTVGLSSASTTHANNIDSAYQIAFRQIKAMLFGEEKLSFKKAIFITENAYNGNELDYTNFENMIRSLKEVANGWLHANSPNNYKYSDSINLYSNWAIFEVLKDTISLLTPNGHTIKSKPFAYNFDDFSGEKDWQDMFVTKLLETHLGNCHSLPYLYKIMADELNANCWLSFAPYHIYLKNRCQEIGWYNTELTSGQFPIDAWIMASGYISTDAVRSGIYMDTLSTQQAVANCALDLAKGYEREYKIYTDSFIIKCCDLALNFHPNNINAIVYKAETLKKMYLIYTKNNAEMAAKIYSEMEALYVHALDLGYKEMPEKMYKEWLFSIASNSKKYSSRKPNELILKNR